ncbi:virA/G regulated protein (plasmid) [Rhizobium rhizogenes]|uniref:virA/G regulated protein n=1 Tax=Rhizobium rhizogenes TaxID=359 RepID=UPI0015731633|nr:virA/G regulated protein [Rhizobium rhizogenes]NTI26894.1 virA/G regulated protein [Rhizobium rhizogenes]QTG10351.1 virA/G regulated protein [Rhizobium rhizogenes]
MVSITKKTVAKSPTIDMRRATQRLVEQMRNAVLTEEKAMKRRGRFEAPQKKQKYAADIRLVDKLGADFQGEISYKLLGNKRLRVDNARELTREHGLLRKNMKVLKRNLETGEFHLSLHERKTWASVTRHQYGEDGTLRTKHVKHRDGRFEEKWERDENDTLIRTRYVNRGRLNRRLFQGTSEEMTAPYRGGPENRLYRKLTRQVGSKRETFERDDKGNLELIARKGLGFSKNSTKAEDRNTSHTRIRKLGGAFNKSYRSLLDKEGNELGRDILSHRRLFNKRSAIYDDATGELKGTKHTFGKLYKNEAEYLGDQVIKVSKKILGVTVQRRLRGLNEQEHDAQTLRALESVRHKQAWQEREAVPRSSQKGAAVPQLVLAGLAQNELGSRAKAEVAGGKGGPVDAVEQTPPSTRRLDRRSNSQPSSSLDLHVPTPNHQPRVANLDGGPAAHILPHHDQTGVQAGKSLSKPVEYLFSPTHSESNVPAPPLLAGVREPANKVGSQGQSVSSAPNSRASDSGQQDLLNFLHSVPVPTLPARNGRGLGNDNADTSVPESSVAESMVYGYSEGHLARDRSTNGSIDPQSLFGEPNLSRLPGLGPASSSRVDHLSGSEQEALLNELLNMPLPVSPHTVEPPESNTPENSRSRERSASRSFSL